MLDAVPIDANNATIPAEATTVAFDAVETFAGLTPAQATELVFDRYGNATTGLCKLNPGYESQSKKAILHPKITRGPSLGPIDYVVKQRLFDILRGEVLGGHLAIARPPHKSARAHLPTGWVIRLQSLPIHFTAKPKFRKNLRK